MGKFQRKPVDKKVLVSSDEEEEQQYSAEDSENDSSDNDNAVSKKKRSKQDDSDVDDPLSVDEMKKGSEHKPGKLFKKEITLMSEEEIKNKYRYKKHQCALSDLPTKSKVRRVSENE